MLSYPVLFNPGMLAYCVLVFQEFADREVGEFEVFSIRGFPNEATTPIKNFVFRYSIALV